MFQKLYRHLEEVNANLRRQEAAIGISAAHEKEILQQLQVLNETIELGKQDLRIAVKKPSPVFSIIIPVMACLAIGALVLLIFEMSDLNGNIVNIQEKTGRQIEMVEANAHDRQNQYGQQREVAAQLARLDSIVSQQNQAILELKDLDKISLHTFIRLKNRLDQTDHVIRTLQTDSAPFIGRAR